MLVVEGDSLAVGMREPLTRLVHVSRYDAAVGRTTSEGLFRLRHVSGRIVLVSLGTNDVGHSKTWAHWRIRSLMRRGPRCVVWGLTTNNAPFNRALREIKDGRLHLVRAVKPDGGDGIHLSAHGYRVRARRFADKMKTC